MEKDKAEEIRQARKWIKANLIPIKTPNNRAGVHIFKDNIVYMRNDIGECVSLGEKERLLKADEEKQE